MDQYIHRLLQSNRRTRTLAVRSKSILYTTSLENKNTGPPPRPIRRLSTVPFSTTWCCNATRSHLTLSPCTRAAARSTDRFQKRKRRFSHTRSGAHCGQRSRKLIKKRWRRLEPRVRDPGWLRRPSRLHCAILESGHTAILELSRRQINRNNCDQDSNAADDHSNKSNAELGGHQNLRAAKSSLVRFPK
jgi:hypothetical protein